MTKRSQPEEFLMLQPVLTLYLPRGVLEEEEFKELMFLAIKGSLGFGKV